MLQLKYIDERAPKLWLANAKYGIGQNKQNDIVIDESDISAFHAEIRRENDALYISDLGSESGTFVNGEPIKDHYQLRAGDTLKFGHVELSLLDPKTTLAQVDDSFNSTPQKSGWSLHTISGRTSNRSYPIKGLVTVGRSKTVDISIDDERLSRTHFEVVDKISHLEIRDLNSANGTQVNGKSVDRSSLKSGDTIKASDISFIVVGPKSADIIAEDSSEETLFLSYLQKAVAANSPHSKASKSNHATRGAIARQVQNAKQQTSSQENNHAQFGSRDANEAEVSNQVNTNRSKAMAILLITSISVLCAFIALKLLDIV